MSISAIAAHPSFSLDINSFSRPENDPTSTHKADATPDQARPNEPRPISRPAPPPPPPPIEDKVSLSNNNQGVHNLTDEGLSPSEVALSLSLPVDVVDLDLGITSSATTDTATSTIVSAHVR